MRMEVKVVDSDLLCLPVDPIKYATRQSAGLDLRAIDITPANLNPIKMEQLRIDDYTTLYKDILYRIFTGVHVAIPPGNMGILTIRSSASTRGLALINSVGIIDSDYRGEVQALVKPWKECRVNKLDRLFQLVITPVTQVKISYVNSFSLDTDRGTGGFGSTGVD